MPTTWTSNVKRIGSKCCKPKHAAATANIYSIFTYNTITLFESDYPGIDEGIQLLLNYELFSSKSYIL